MIQNVLRHLGGIEAYGEISIGLFFLVFLGVLVWAWRLKKPYLDTMSQLPLDAESDQSKRSETRYE
jgi:cbb3-type cytochrome oxidase subunit 3